MDDPPQPEPRQGEDGRAAAPRVSRRTALLLLGGAAAGLAAVPVLDRLSPSGSSAAPPPTGSSAAPSPTGSSAAPSTAEAPTAGTLDAKDFGATGDGTTDDTAAVQRLIDATAQQARVGVLPAGTYRCTRSLLLPAGAQLQLDSGARLLKDWAAPPGLTEAFLRNADFAAKSDGVQISGAGTIGAADHGRTGVILGLYGDDVAIRDITVDTYAGGQAVMFAGDRGRIERVTVRNSAAKTGTGGIRVIGGTDFLGTDCHVESGDDCFQFVPIGNPEAEPTLYNQSISGGRFTGCTGVSAVSRFMVALLEFTGGDPGTTDMDASVSDCSFVDCHGAGANRGIVVKNTHSSGAIQRLTFTDCSVDMSAAADESTQEIRVQTAPESRGAIRDVTFTRTDMTHAVNSTLRAGGPNISGLTFDDCTFTAPTGAAPLTAVVDGTDRPTFRGCTFVGAPGKRMLVAGPATPVTALSVEDCTFTEISDRAFGVDVLKVTGARVTGSTFRSAAGTTTARAIRVAPGASGVVIEGNDFTGISHAQPIADRAVDTTLGSNRGR
ncbi:glycosyl hydrolase family 28-related protein [Geodermatophilus sp. URMC 64]